VLDIETKDYLERLMKDLERVLDLKLQAAIEKMSALFTNSDTKHDALKETTNRHSTQIDELYKFQKQTIEDLGKLDGRIGKLEDDKTDKKTNTGFIISICALVMSIIFAIIGWLR
jgi:hypothetical protein